MSRDLDAAPEGRVPALLAEASDLVLRYGKHTALAASTFTVPLDL